MPCYEYECDCGWKGDRIVNADDADQQSCPSRIIEVLIPHYVAVDQAGNVTIAGAVKKSTTCGKLLRRIEISLTAAPVIAEAYGALVGARHESTHNMQVVAGKWGERSPIKGPRRRLK